MAKDTPTKITKDSSFKDVVGELQIIQKEIREMNLRQKEINEQIFGNGGAGIRTQVAKINQILKILAFVAGTALVLLIGDFYRSATQPSQSELQKELIQSVMEMKENQRQIKSKVDVIERQN